MSRRRGGGLARRGSETPVRQLHLRVAPPRDALDRFEAAWNRIAEGGRVASVRVLTLQDLPLLLRTLTPARWALVERLKKEGPLSVYQLAKRLERDYKNVHTDVAQLVRLGIVERQGDGVAVPWELLRAELGF
jgi:predicted transcriptional regulator